MCGAVGITTQIIYGWEKSDNQWIALPILSFPPSFACSVRSSDEWRGRFILSGWSGCLSKHNDTVGIRAFGVVIDAPTVGRFGEFLVVNHDQERFQASRSATWDH